VEDLIASKVLNRFRVRSLTGSLKSDDGADVAMANKSSADTAGRVARAARQFPQRERREPQTEQPEIGISGDAQPPDHELPPSHQTRSTVAARQQPQPHGQRRPATRHRPACGHAQLALLGWCFQHRPSLGRDRCPDTELSPTS
jgi:hypothetical protein